MISHPEPIGRLDPFPIYGDLATHPTDLVEADVLLVHPTVEAVQVKRLLVSWKGAVPHEIEGHGPLRTRFEHEPVGAQRLQNLVMDRPDAQALDAGSQAS